MKVIKYWVAKDTEAHFEKHFRTEKDARMAAKGNGFYGADATVYQEEIKIYDSFEEWRQEKELVKMRGELKARLDTISDVELIEQVKTLLQKIPPAQFDF